MKIYNSLTKKVEDFKPINSQKVGMYTCGPTVYSYPTIGNYRTYVTADLLLRTLKFLDYKVEYVMNLTDVGHLTGDNSGDADTGEDRLEKAAKKEGKNAWDIAKFYSNDFKESFSKINMIVPDHLVAATDHIREQIDLVKKLEEKKLTYKIDDGIYFDTVAYEKETGEKYGELSTLDQLKEGTRIEPSPQKKNPRDFALWKFSISYIQNSDDIGKFLGNRQMEWWFDGPFESEKFTHGNMRSLDVQAQGGVITNEERHKYMSHVGFPGWHIECSAMSMKYLGDQFDIHAGGEDLRSTHHPNEIAQSEGATGKIPFVKYWVHGAFLTVDGGRMGKSLGNAYTLHDIEKKGFSDLDLRYFYLSGHYRKQLNFTWEALTSAQNALEKLRTHIQNLKSDGKKSNKGNEFKKAFESAISDDLNMPESLAVFWSMLKSDISDSEKHNLAMNFDEVLGLKLNETKKKETPKEVKKLLEKRESLRKEGKYEEADAVRDEIIKMGYTVSDAASKS